MRLLPPSPLINGVLYEEITSAGDVEPSWPELLPGCKAVFDLVQAPAGSSATASLSGLLEDADLPGAYILQRSAVRMGQVASRDFAIVHWPASGEDVSAPVPPARVEMVAGSTSSGTRTWTHADPPTDPVYTLSVICVTDGTTVTPTGADLEWSWPVETGKAYAATLTCTSGDFSATADPFVLVVSDYSALAWEAPTTGTATAGSTSVVVTWATPTGGVEPYTYTDPGITYDSQAASSTAALSQAGAGAGATTVSGLVNGQVVVLQRTVTDAEGTPRTVQGVATVAPAAATITPGTAPAGQALAAGATSVTIGTWGAPSGGTGPYTYAVTELGGSGVTISGSGLGAWSAVGLSDGITYAFLLTVTDSLSAKGYSVVTVSVAPSEALGGYILRDHTDFTDADWTALSSTNNTTSTSAWQHTLYEADGTTPRAYIYNNVADSRSLTLSPSGSGLVLSNGATTSQPTIGVWPAGWTPLLGGPRRSAWLVRAVIEGEEPAGVGAFTHMLGISVDGTTMATSPGTGFRVKESGSNLAIRAFSYISGFAEQTVQPVAAGATRRWRAEVQITICDQRRHDVFFNVGATTPRDPETGVRVRIQSSSTSMTAPNADVAATFAWFASTIQSRLKFWMYHDGTATSGSYIALKSLSLFEMPRGSR